MDGQQYFVKQFGQVDEIVTFEYSSAVNPADYRTPGQYLKALLDALDTRSTALRALVQQWRDEADLLDADAEGMAVDSSLPVAGALTGEAEQLRACADQLAALLED